MRFLTLLFLMIFISCGDKKEQQEDPMKPKTGISEDMELSGSYVLRQLRNEDVSSEEITLNIDEERKEIMGNAGCNRFSARYEREGENIEIEQPVSTKMFCEGKMEREQEIIDLLTEISKVGEQENRLIFSSESGENILTVQKNN